MPGKPKQFYFVSFYLFYPGLQVRKLNHRGGKRRAQRLPSAQCQGWKSTPLSCPWGQQASFYPCLCLGMPVEPSSC